MLDLLFLYSKNFSHSWRNDQILKIRLYLENLFCKKTRELHQRSLNLKIISQSWNCSKEKKKKWMNERILYKSLKLGEVLTDSSQFRWLLLFFLPIRYPSFKNFQIITVSLINNLSRWGKLSRSWNFYRKSVSNLQGKRVNLKNFAQFLKVANESRILGLYKLLSFLWSDWGWGLLIFIF